MGPAPVCVAVQTPISEVTARMAAASASAAVVVDDGGQLSGIVTEQDIVRRIAFRAKPDTSVGRLMSAPVITVGKHDFLFNAIALMRRCGLRHIPVVDENQRICGMLAQHEALAFSARPLIELIDRLTHEDTLEGLREVKNAQVALAELFLADHVPIPEVQALITEINSDLHRRVLRLALAEMAAAGLGEPPVAFSLIVMGSGGRGENFLFPDQDNGFVLADYPDAQHDRIDAYFIELAQRMTGLLDHIGFPLCRGHIMASNPLWRKTLSQWREQVKYWMRKRSSVTLRLSDVFFDFAHVFGDPELSANLRRFVTSIARQNPSYLQEMYGLQADHRVALGMFRRLRTEIDELGKPGMIDLKYGGTLPLVEAIRLFALQHGVAATSTLDRIDALHRLRVFDDNKKDYLKGALAHITFLLLRQQIMDFKAGRPVRNLVPKANLSKREKDYLIACFRAVGRLRGDLHSMLSAQIF